MKVITFLLIAATILMVVACGDDDEPSDGSNGASPTASVCDDKAAVEEAVADLANIDITAEGTNALNAAVDNVKTELQDLKTTVSEDVADEVEGLETAVDDAQETLSGIGDDSTLNQRIDAVQSALTGIATAAEDLTTALQNEC